MCVCVCVCVRAVPRTHFKVLSLEEEEKAQDRKASTGMSSADKVMVILVNEGWFLELKENMQGSMPF